MFKPSFHHYHILIEQHFTVFIIELLDLATSQHSRCIIMRQVSKYQLHHQYTLLQILLAVFD